MTDLAKQMVNRAILLMFIILFLLGCVRSRRTEITDKTVDILADDLLKKVAILEPLNFDTIDSFEKYQGLTDNLNDLIDILNEQSDIFNIPHFETTREGWSKASRFITEYSPLIDNYNDVVQSAKEYENESNADNLKKFYFEAGTFGFEAGVIVFGVFYPLSFESVGTVYRFVGLNNLALKCGSCVSVILSNAHWSLRTTLVEGSSLAVRKTLSGVERVYNATQNEGGVANYTNNKIENLEKFYSKEIKPTFS